MTPPLRFGFAIPSFANPGMPEFRTPNLEALDWQPLAAAACTAERLGYDSLWIGDHTYLGHDGAILEAWTTLSALATVTSSVRLGTIHLCNALRHPPLLAKMAATLDVISGGRLELFLDTGFRERELAAYGLQWGKRSTRVQRLAEAIELIRLLWTGEPVSFNGAHYQLHDAICRPIPITQPAPRIWLGEAFDDMLDLIARSADIWNSTPARPEVLADKIRTIDVACERHGRDPASLPKTLETQVLIYDRRDDAEALFRHFAELRRRHPPPAEADELERMFDGIDPERARYDGLERARDEFVVGTPAEVTERLAHYAELGISEIICWFMDFPQPTSMQRLAIEIMPALSSGTTSIG